MAPSIHSKQWSLRKLQLTNSTRAWRFFFMLGLLSYSYTAIAQYVVESGSPANPQFDNPIDITLGTDDLSDPLDIGFNFDFFGNTYAQCYVSSNGFITFQAAGGSGLIPQTLPDANNPNDLIAVIWASHSPDYSMFSYETMGTAPNRTFHVNFYLENFGLPPACSSGYYLDAQLILYESSNIIEIHTTTWDGDQCNLNATQGIENADGSLAVTPVGYNNAIFGASDIFTRFIPESYTDLAVDGTNPVLCSGTQDIKILVSNPGGATVDTFYADWTWDGIPQDAVAIYESLPHNAATEITLGQMTIDPGSTYNLKAWTYDPENQPDDNFANDTLNTIVKAGLSGDYTIGGTTPDFNTIADAITELINQGACDTVVFSIRTGVYTEELDIPFLDISQGSLVIFQSESGNAQDVTITKNYTSGSTNRLIDINNASHLHFKHLTLKITGSVCATVVYANAYCEDIVFENCQLIGTTCNSTTTSGAVISMVNGQKDGIRLENNLIRKGSYGLYLYPGSTSYANDFVLQNNTIDSFYRYGAYLYRSLGMNVTGNSIFSPGTNAIGMEANTIYGPCTISQQQITIPAGVYGMRIYRYQYLSPLDPDTMYVYNNMISMAGAVSDSRAMLLDQSTKVRVHHNNIHTTSTSTTSYALYAASNTSCDVINNVITNLGSGPAAYLATITSDHNDYYSASVPLISNGTAYNTLEDWVISTGQDQQSLQVNPDYTSNTDLHVHEGALNSAGNSLTPAVQEDFDLQNRNLTTPDIGADEFGFEDYDLSVSDFFFSADLEEGANDVKVSVFNIGLSDVDSFKLEWKVNDNAQVPVSVNLPLAAGHGDTILLGTVLFEPGTPLSFQVNSKLPAAHPDEDMTNDTITIGPLYARMNGVYTVGGDNPDFPLLSQAFAAITLGGIVDSVDLAVRDGMYSDPITLSSNAVYTCAKPVHVYGESLDSTAVEIDNNNLVQPVIRLNGVSGITFSHMSFRLTTSAFHNTIIIENGASCNRFDHCTIEGRFNTSTTTTAYAAALCNSNQGVDNDFYHCTFKYGSYGLYTNGPVNSTGSLVDILENSFINNYSQGLSVTNSRYARIIGNYATITAPQHSSYIGMFASYCNSMIMSHNVVINPYTGGSALGFTECDGTSLDTTNVFNNFIYSGTTNNLASILTGSYSNYTHVSNNTSWCHQGHAAGVSWSSNFVFDNNILKAVGSNTVGLEWLNMQGSSNVSNNNVFYVPEGDVGEYNNVKYKTLQQWQALGFDAISIYVDPWLLNNTYIPHSIHINNKAIPYDHISDDIEGQSRDAVHPDPGAYEFTPAAADAGLLKILSPNMPFPSGDNAVYIRFENNGLDTLFNLDVYWEVNDIPQEPFTWTGILPSAAQYDSLQIGTYVFQPYQPYQVKIWVAQPNGVADAFHANDTLEITGQYPGLEGVYTIGGDSPDFETLHEAATAINIGGAAGPVTFTIRDGVYADTIRLIDFAGSDCDRPVIFQSESGDSSLVVVSNLGLNAYPIVLDGADGIEFRNMTIKSVNTAYRHVVLFSNGAHCNTFEGNTLKGYQSTATASTSAVIRSTAGLDTANVFSHNRILDGSYSFHLTGNGGGITHTLISDNHMEPYYRGVYNSALQGVTITHNVIIADNNTSSIGIELTTGHNLLEISYNNIQTPLGQYGINLDNCDNTASTRGKIFNNFISVGGTSVARGIYLNGSAYQDVLHNSILVYSTNGTLANTTPLYINNSPNVRLLNNATRNAGSGYAIYANGNTTFLSNHNALNTNGATFAYWNGGTAETTFDLWKTASGQDAASVNINPAFMSNTNLHTFLVILNEAGDPTTGIPDDIDGMPRDSLPDIGADEFDPLPSNDAGIFMFAGPHIPFAAGNHPVQLVIKNFGGNPLTSAEVHWTVNGIEQTPYTWTGNLPSAICDTFPVGNYAFEDITSYNIDAWTVMPNNTADANPDNDLFTTSEFYPSLSGIYTVGGFAPDFNQVSELETILNASGIVGNVTFSFRPGEYQEALTISDFPRTSYAHTVTFESASGDSTDVLLTQTANNTVLVDLDDAHRVTFSHMSFYNAKGHLFQIRNGSSQVTLTHNHLESPEAISSSRALVYSSTTTEDSLSILNNHFHHGYYGIYLYGGDYEKRHIISGNIFTGKYQYCVYLRKFDGLTLSDNVFQATSTVSTDAYLYTGTGACTISKNRIISDGIQPALYLGTLTNTSATSSSLSNNFIYTSGTASYDAVQVVNVAKINIDFNTVYNAVAHLNSAALYTENLTTHNIRNNIVYSAKGPAFHNSGTLPTVHNYNLIFSMGPVTSIQNTTSYSTLAAYASGTGTNANSIDVDPLFYNSANPDVGQYLLNGAGTTIAGITTDIDGTTRSTPPDIGAKEFTPVTYDVKVAQVVTPVSGCGLGEEEVQVALVNFGSLVATGFDIYYSDQGSDETDNIGSLQVPPGDTLLYTFSNTIDVSAFASYTLPVWIDFSADVNSANDTLIHEFENLPPLNAAPGNLIPANGTSGLENQVSLSWAPVTNAVTYDVYLWPQTTNKPASPTYPGLTTINKLVTNLEYGTAYYWQVYAVNICNEQLGSDTSAFSTRFLPDLIVQSITIPPTAFSEQTIGVEWVTRNDGDGATVPGSWYENIYLSIDPTYNSFDPLLASVSNLNALNADESYIHSANVVLPQGTNGLYYIIVKTDHYNAVKEISNNNNTTYSASQINVTLSPPPDLVVTQITTPAITFSGESINITYTVQNLGIGVTAESIWKDEVTLSPAPGNEDGISTSLGIRTRNGILLPDSSYLVSMTVAIPENIYGDYQLRVVTDSRNDVFEFASEGNNYLLSNVFEVVLTPPADLVPDSLIVPDTLSLYATYAMQFQVKNQGGSAPSTSFTDRYYLSQSPVYNSNFLIHLGYAYHNPGLLPGQAETKSVNVKLTGNYSGIYYIYVVTDYNDKIDEYAFEGNNILRSDPIEIIRPDLVPDSLIHPSSVMSGSTITVRTEVINQGYGSYYGSMINRYYLSDDDSLSTLTDMLLSSRSVNNVILTPEDTISNTFSLTMPEDQFGSKYLLVLTDAGQSVFESNETNNVLASPVTVFEAPHPDVWVVDLEAPDTITAGIPFSLAYTLTNQGDVPVTIGVTDSIFISFSPSWNRSTAAPLLIRQTPLLDTQQLVSYLLSPETTLQQNPNIYYIYIISDATQKVYEGSGEANNIKRSEQIVLNSYPEIDLVLDTLWGLPDTLTSGASYNLQYEVSNQGAYQTYFSSWTDRYYFSVDSIFQPSTDMQLGSVAYSGGVIGAGDTKSVSTSIHVPDGISGNYYFFIETDVDDVNDDVARVNNANTLRVTGGAKQIHVKLALYPDLQPTLFDCPVDIISGQPFTIILNVTNSGPGTAGSRTDKIFVSNNAVIDAGDLTLASLSKGILGSQQEQADTLSVFVPANYAGNYFVIYAVDHGNIVYEHNQEGNNMVLASIVATPPPPADLIVQNILVPDSVLAGESGEMTWETKNIGSNPASGIYREVVYLSPDTIWNLTDEVMGVWDGTINLGAGSMITKTVAFPYNNVINDDYHTIIRTDARNNIPETLEDNNDGFSFDKTNVDIREMFFDIEEDAFLTAGVNRYYKIFIGAEDAGRNFLISLNGDSTAGINQMYVKYAEVPTPADHDYAYDKPFSPHQRIVVRNAQPGYYYIMINGFKVGSNTPQAITVLARMLLMEILAVTPNEGGDKGFTTIEAFGSELDSIVTVKLVRADTLQDYYEIVADTFMMMEEGTRVVARFNLAGQPLGEYHLQCLRESIWMASYENAFEVIEGSGSEIQLHWDFNPKTYNPRFTTLFQIKVDVENTGDSDAEDRYIRVGSPEYDNPMYYTLADYYNQIVHTQLVLAAEDLYGFPGILRPGGRRTFYVIGRIGGTQGFSISYDK